MKKIRQTKEILEEAVSASVSMAGVIRFLNKKQAGGTHRHFKRMIERFEIDTSHFLGCRTNCGVNHKGGNKKKDYSDILVINRLNGRKETVFRLRRALIESGVEYKCSECGLSEEWNGKIITLEVHHLNSDFTDNRKENLKFLCPNCHSQETKKIQQDGVSHFYCACGAEIKKDRKLCGDCILKNKKPKVQRVKIPRKRKVEHPLKEDLEKMIAELPMTKIGKMFGVSDNAVKKWCKNYGIELGSRLGYWTKIKYSK